MRARNLKPGFFKNEVLGTADPFVRLLFEGLWCMADRQGRLEDRPARIKAECLPYDTVNVDHLLNVLASKGFIVRYEVEGRRYVSIINFTKHQRPHQNELESVIPGPDAPTSTIGASASTIGASTSLLILTPSSLTPDSTNTPLPPRGGEAAAAPDEVSANPQNSKRTRTPGVTPEELLAAWNAIPGVRPAKGINGPRLRQFHARLREPDWVSQWRYALDRVAALPCFAGHNDRDWRATLDWFLRPGSLLKVIEGHYDNWGRSGNGQPARNKIDAVVDAVFGSNTDG